LFNNSRVSPPRWLLPTTPIRAGTRW
jgi:hypothetical protein